MSLLLAWARGRRHEDMGAAGQASLAALPAAGWLVLGLLAVWLLRVWLGATSGATLHVDEAQYWDWSRHLQWGYYSKPPGIATLIAASGALFGDTPTGVRLLATLCYPATALVLALLAADIARDWRAGIWAAAVFSLSPVAGVLGMVATTDALLLLCWSLAMLALWCALAYRAPAAWALLAVAAWAGLMSKYSFAAFIAGAAVLVWRHGRVPDRLAFAGCMAVVALACLPHLGWNAEHDWPTPRHTAQITLDRGQSAAGWGQGALDAVLHVAGFIVGQWLVLAPLAVLVVAHVMWRGLRGVPSGARAAPSVPDTRARALLYWLSLPLLLAGLLVAARSGAELNWAAPLVLMLSVWLGVWVTRAGTRGRGALVLALGAQWLLTTALAAAPTMAQRVGVEAPQALDLWGRLRGWPQAYAQLADGLPLQGPGVVVIGASRTVIAHAAYEWRGFGHRRAALGSAPGMHGARNHYELLCAWDPARHHAQRVYLLALGSAADPGVGRPGDWQLLRQVRVHSGAGREVALQLWTPAPGTAYAQEAAASTEPPGSWDGGCL